MAPVVTSFTLAQAFFHGPSTLSSTTRARPGLLRSPQQVRGLLVAFDSFYASLTARALRDVKHDRLLHSAHDALIEQLRLLESGKATREGVRQEIEFLARQLDKISDSAFKAAVARAKHTGLNLFAKFDGASVREVLRSTSRPDTSFLHRSVDELWLPRRLLTSFKKSGMNNVNDFLSATERELAEGGLKEAMQIRRMKFLIGSFGREAKTLPLIWSTREEALSAKTVAALQKAEIYHFGALVKLRETDLLSKGLSRASVTELKKMLAFFGWSLTR